MEEKVRRMEEEKKKRGEDYREWLGGAIEGITGRLNGERGIWGLDTDSMERVFLALR